MCEDITTFIGAYGNREVRTPNIDQLAKEGVLYTRAYQTAGVCTPSHAALITGMYPTSIDTQRMRTGHGEITLPGSNPKVMPDGVPTYSVMIPDSVKAFPEHLRKAGY